MSKNTKTAPWEVGDSVTVGGTRWKITALNPRTKAVQLEALSTTNHGMRWTTTLPNLPRKAGVMTEKNNAQYVHDELLEIVSAAVDVGLAEYVGFVVQDGALTAEVYDADGNVAGTWSVSVTVTEAVQP